LPPTATSPAALSVPSLPLVAPLPPPLGSSSLAGAHALACQAAETAKSEANTQIDFMNAFLRGQGASLRLALTPSRQHSIISAEF
jgi:hypothetical protein